MYVLSYRSLVVSAVVAVLTCGAAISRGETAKDFTLRSATDGSLIRLSDYSGKVVLIHFWQTTCGWCVYVETSICDFI